MISRQLWHPFRMQLDDTMIRGSAADATDPRLLSGKPSACGSRAPQKRNFKKREQGGATNPSPNLARCLHGPGSIFGQRA